MNEAEWLTCTEPERMLKYLRGKVSERKVRLFACACCRQFWSRLEDRRTRSVVEVAEQVADGLASPTALLAAWLEDRRTRSAVELAAGRTTYWMWAIASPGKFFGGFEAAHTGCWVLAEEVEPLTLLRDMVGNPFRPATLAPAFLVWNDCTIPKLAQASYDERHLPAGTLDNSRLAILADALEEAGCTSEDILGHLRGPGPHVRGCWAVDLILGKE